MIWLWNKTPGDREAVSCIKCLVKITNARFLKKKHSLPTPILQKIRQIVTIDEDVKALRERMILEQQKLHEVYL